MLSESIRETPLFYTEMLPNAVDSLLGNRVGRFFRGGRIYSGARLAAALDFVSNMADKDFDNNSPFSSLGWAPLVFIFSGSKPMNDPRGDLSNQLEGFDPKIFPIDRIKHFREYGWGAVQAFDIGPKADTEILNQLSDSEVPVARGNLWLNESFDKKRKEFRDDAVEMMRTIVMDAMRT
jgi:hypothetical protein